MTDLLLLVFVLLQADCLYLIPFFNKRSVVAVKEHRVTRLNLHDFVDDLVQEIPVMGDQDDSALIVA